MKIISIKRFCKKLDILVFFELLFNECIFLILKFIFILNDED